MTFNRSLVAAFALLAIPSAVLAGDVKVNGAAGNAHRDAANPHPAYRAVQLPCLTDHGVGADPRIYVTNATQSSLKNFTVFWTLNPGNVQGHNRVSATVPPKTDVFVHVSTGYKSTCTAEIHYLLVAVKGSGPV
jgi:hypothetical protein